MLTNVPSVIFFFAGIGTGLLGIFRWPFNKTIKSVNLATKVLKPLTWAQHRYINLEDTVQTPRSFRHVGLQAANHASYVVAHYVDPYRTRVRRDNLH